MAQRLDRPLGTHPLWGIPGLHLPPFYRELTRLITRDSGRPMEQWTGQDIRAAINTSKRWASGQGDVSLNARRKASKANAEWERTKAKAAKRRAGK